jgi:LysM repeat protein
VPSEIREYQLTALTTIAAPLPSSYTVAEGDTLFDIATALESSVEALVFANNLEDLDLLQIGQVLVVPPPGSARQPTDPARSLAEIAASYSLDARALAAYNGVTPELVYQPIAREALLFPPGAMPLGFASGEQSAEGGLLASIPFGAERPLEPFVYRVRPGDTLTDVAWRLGIDVDTILNNNSDLGDGDFIRIGHELLVLPISGLLYQVQEGDTVSGIAEKFGVDLDPILEFNSLSAAGAIELGMELILPGAGPVYALPMQPGVARIAVPYRSQLDGTPWAGANCGPTALGMGLESLGIKMSSTELRRQVLNAQGIWGNNVGTLMDALAKVGANNGARPIGLFDGNRIAKWSLSDLREQLKAGRPVIVQVRFRALPGRAGVRYYNDHYIILTGLSGDNFLYNDPIDSDGPGANRLMTPAQLESAMNTSDKRYAYAAFALAR